MSFYEATPVRSTAAKGKFLWIADGVGLWRWDGTSSQRVELPDNALPLAVAVHEDTVWVASATRLYRSQDGQRFRPVGKTLPGGTWKDVRLIAAATGVWVAGDRGLWRVDAGGRVAPTALGDAVTAFHWTGQHIYAAVGGTLYLVRPDGAARTLGPEFNCEMNAVERIGPSALGVLVAGTFAGKRRLLLVRDGRCEPHQLENNAPWHDIVAAGELTYALVGDEVFELSRPGKERPVQAPALAIAGEPFLTRRVRHQASRPQSMVVYDDALWLATPTQGLARIGERMTWMRRRSLVGDAKTLSVACAAPKDCLLSFGGAELWHFDGNEFQDVGDSKTLYLAVVRDRDGRQFAVTGQPDRGGLVIRPIQGDGPVAVDIPGKAARLTFAEMAPTAELWLGVEYFTAGDWQPHGVVAVNPALGLVSYHHASRDKSKQARGVLPIPVSARDIAFCGDDVWIATTEGAARITGTTVEMDSETTGLKSELLRGVACTRDGQVFVASGAGVGVRAGVAWRYPPTMARSATWVEVAPDGAVWTLDAQGLSVYRGNEVAKLPEGAPTRPVAADIDQFGRVWVVADGGVTVLMP